MPIRQEPTRGTGGNKRATPYSRRDMTRQDHDSNQAILRSHSKKDHSYNAYNYDRGKTPLGLRDRTSSGKIKQIEGNVKKKLHGKYKKRKK